METETISITLTHYRAQDYECKNSKLTCNINVNDTEQIINITGLRAESFYQMIKEMAQIVEKEEKESGNNKETSDR